MKLVIAGSRHINGLKALEIIEEWFRYSEKPVTEIISGTARGVDTAGELYAQKHGIKITRFPADWESLGKPAGMIRNREMAKYGDALLLVWDGSSKGSFNMKQNMEDLGKPVFEEIVK